MSRENYGACLKHVLKWEGGYVDHPKDPGGATNHGITRATLSKHRGKPVSKQDVRDLSVAEAGEIYRPRYWLAVRGDDLPDGMDLVAFDGGVNSGPSRGARWLQKGLGVAADGRIGPQTIEAALTHSTPVKAIQRACLARMGFLRQLRTWSTFGKGWARRVADTEATAVAMHTRSVSALQDARAAVGRSRDLNRGGAAASMTGSGAGTLADVPDWAIYLAVAVGVIVALKFALNALRDSTRWHAYHGKIQEMING